MGEDVTYLVVPDDARAYAQRFGAQCSPAGDWYVLGSVPRELLNFLPRRANARFYEEEPPCPICGSTMRKHVRSGNVSWRCRAWFRTGCPGNLAYEDYLEDRLQESLVGDYLPRPGSLLLPTPAPAPAPAHAPDCHDALNPDLPRKRWQEIVAKAFVVLGSEKQVMRWLEQPKVALGGKAPIRCLGTPSECDAVMRLLNELLL